MLRSDIIITVGATNFGCCFKVLQMNFYSKALTTYQTSNVWGGVQDMDGQHEILKGPAGPHTSQLDFIVGLQSFQLYSVQ
jgi:hypothetical protein